MQFSQETWASRLDHRSRWLRQWISRPDIAVVGGYHSGNLGDMALAWSTVGQIKNRTERGNSIGVQTIYNLEKWPAAGRVVVGGGALLNSKTVKSLRAHTNNSPEKVGIIGVDLSKGKLDREDVDFLRQVAFLSFRSDFSLQEAQQDYKLHNARVAPDVVFSNDESLFFSHKEEKQAAPMLGINVVGGLGRYRARTPEIDKALHQMYLRWMRDTITGYLDSGYSVSSIPFTHNDERVCRENFADLPIHHQRYSHDVKVTVARIRQCETFISSRFHALIFGALLHKKLIPFCYARKNYALSEEFLHIRTFGFRELERALGEGSDISPTQPLKVRPETLDNLKMLVDCEFEDLHGALWG